MEEACRGVEVVFHLAALVAIPFSYRAPDSFVATNVAGTLNVLEAARRSGCARVVFTSTSEVYGTPDSYDIGHAFRMTVRATNGYVYPASHRAGSTAGALPMGARLRLKASRDLSGFRPEIRRSSAPCSAMA